MARTRTLTIASMAAPGWVKINEVANIDMTFTALCGGRVTVTRSSDGKTYSWDTDTNHIRIYIKMEGPTDLAFITHNSRGAGWYILDGFPQIALGSEAHPSPPSPSPRPSTEEKLDTGGPEDMVETKSWD